MAANADWVVPASHDERRYAVGNVNERWKQNEDYFIPLFAEIKAGGAAASPQQMRATIEALPYEVPKLSAVGVGYFTHDTFAERLDRAIDQSNRVLVEGHAR